MNPHSSRRRAYPDSPRWQSGAWPRRPIAWAAGWLCAIGAIALVAGGQASASITFGEVAGGPLTVSGSMRMRDYTWSYFNPGNVPAGFGGNRQYNYGAMVMRLGLGYRIDGVKLFVEGMNPTFLALPDDATAPPPQGALGLGANYYVIHKNSFDSSLFLKQGYVELGGRVFRGPELPSGLDIKGGRLEFFDGLDLPVDDSQIQWITRNRVAQRLIGNFGWSDVTRSFDGAQVRYGGPNWNTLVFYGVPTRGVFDLSGMDEISAVDVLYAAMSGFSDRFAGNSLGRVFYIWYDDNRGLAPVDNEPAAAAKANTRPISIDTIGADFIHDIRLGPGTADMMLWGAYQWGSWGRLAQRAYAATVEFGYRFDKLPGTPWLRAGYDMTSGDGNPGDGVHGTFFQVLPTPRVYALDPVYNMMNLTDALAELILFPARNLSIRTTLHGLWLSSGQDRWYYGGGAFDSHIFGYVSRPSFGNSYLGTVLDSGITWIADKHLTLYFYGGHLLGGSVVGANFPSGREETFGYMEALYHF